MHRLLFTAIVLCLTCPAHSAPAPAEGRPEGNPIFPEVRSADPHLTVFGDTFYLYASEYTTLLGKKEPGFTSAGPARTRP